MSLAYYNEIDPKAAAWLRELIKAGHIAPGIVDERSIEDVVPDELLGYAQCHFFAGIGVWSYALRRAGWPDDRAIWTASCPCQPFSQAGEGAGFADERHLWPHLFHLFGQRRPAIVIGEQVASKDANAWLDLVSADLEKLGAAFGAVAFPSAGVGAPHLRERVFWVAQSEYSGRETRESQWPWPGTTVSSGASSGMGHPHSKRARRNGRTISGKVRGEDGQQFPVDADASGAGILAGPSPTNGLWRDADWLLCRDGKWRPVEPGTFPLAHGAAARVGRLRGYGNAINAEAAKAFIEAVMETTI